jgi:hypothetical protein
MTDSSNISTTTQASNSISTSDSFSGEAKGQPLIEKIFPKPSLNLGTEPSIRNWNTTSNPDHAQGESYSGVNVNAGTNSNIDTSSMQGRTTNS